MVSSFNKSCVYNGKYMVRNSIIFLSMTYNCLSVLRVWEYTSFLMTQQEKSGNIRADDLGGFTSVTNSTNLKVNVQQQQNDELSVDLTLLDICFSNSVV